MSTAPGAAPARPQVRVLAEERWRELEVAHHERAALLLAGRQARAARGETHPVHDFLFSYYSFRPSRLRRWHPGAGVALAGAGRDRWAALAGYRTVRAGSPPREVVALDVRDLAERRGPAVHFVAGLLTTLAGRPAQLGCFGLHEWAMVYRQPEPELRHPGWPLRLGRTATDEVVENHRLRCTHHDAFRFFTPAAAPRNAFQPRREDQATVEQPGCLHATMDLYKWAYTLSPAVPGELLLDCFELARDSRELDMRASPYDLEALGYPPVRIETAAGRAEYVVLQRALGERAAPLRARLLAVCQLLDEATGH